MQFLRFLILFIIIIDQIHSSISSLESLAEMKSASDITVAVMTMVYIAEIPYMMSFFNYYSGLGVNRFHVIVNHPFDSMDDASTEMKSIMMAQLDNINKTYGNINLLYSSTRERIDAHESLKHHNISEDYVLLVDIDEFIDISPYQTISTYIQATGSCIGYKFAGSFAPIDKFEYRTITMYSTPLTYVVANQKKPRKSSKKSIDKKKKGSNKNRNDRKNTGRNLKENPEQKSQKGDKSQHVQNTMKSFLYPTFLKSMAQTKHIRRMDHHIMYLDITNTCPGKILKTNSEESSSNSYEPAPKTGKLVHYWGRSFKDIVIKSIYDDMNDSKTSDITEILHGTNSKNLLYLPPRLKALALLTKINENQKMFSKLRRSPAVPVYAQVNTTLEDLLLEGKLSDMDLNTLYVLYEMYKREMVSAKAMRLHAEEGVSLSAMINQRLIP